ncbi:hypothetical protein V6N12_050377 [Hibiscus sabdariffa]|uniref:Putative plant transposon protein domain-containing protein n=1 Tax=Hibiscus sabdariffa TaxID=183260 RepID=A0ABR2GC99_9ROSI
MANNSARYTMVSAKNKWEEQGFHLDDSLPNYGLEQFVYNRLHELGWFRLARQPARANYNWVMEFYTNNAAGEDFSTVRGRRVPATAETINAILDLPNDDPSFYAMLSAFEEEDFEQVKDFLCEEGTAWNTTGRNPHSVSRPSLQPEAKLWNTFVKRNIMPTSHNQTVDRTRLLLIHTIITGYRVNVGEILAKELAAACANDKGILAFPCLISALCRRAAVPTSPSDKYQAEKKGWTRAIFMRKMDVADATPLKMAMPTPPASPNHMPAAPAEEAGPSNPAPASSALAEPRQPSADSPPAEPVVSNTTTSPAATPANMPASRESTPTSPMGSIPEAPHPPPPAQSARQPLSTSYSCATSCNGSRLGSSKCRKKQRDHLHPSAPRPPQQQAAATSARHSSDPADVPILQSAPIPAQPTMETQHRRKGKTTAGRVITRSDQSSPEEEATHQPAQKRRRRHIITSDCDDDCSATVPTSSADASLSFSF